MSEMKQSKTQSVILNLNKSFANSKAHDYLQTVAGQLDIGKNAEVALYSATIRRKPIFVDFDPTDPDFFIKTNYFPNQRQINAANETNALISDDDIIRLDNSNLDTIQKISYLLEKGTYTVNELSNRMVQEINSEILEFNSSEDNKLQTADGSDWTIKGKAVLMQIPYSFIYDKDDYYLGLNGLPLDLGYKHPVDGQPNYDGNSGYLCRSQQFPVSNTETKKTSNVDLEVFSTDYSGQLEDGIFSITANTAISVSNYSEFCRISDSTIFPLFKNHKLDNQNGHFQCNQSFFEFDIVIDETKNSYDMDMVVGFTNTYLQSEWTASNTPALQVAQPSKNNLPEMILGAKFVESKQSGDITESYIELYAPAFITSQLKILEGENLYSSIFDEGLERLCTLNVGGDLGRNGKYGFRFVAHDDQYRGWTFRNRNTHTDGTNVSIRDNVDFYGTVYSFQFYYHPTGEAEVIVYDSAKHNLYIPQNILEDGFLTDQIKSARIDTERVNLGLQPYIWFNAVEEADGISNPRGNYILNYGPRATDTFYYYRGGMSFYEFDFVSRNCREIFNVPLFTDNKTEYNISDDTSYKQKIKTNGTRRFNPNSYPIYKKEAGFTAIYSDFTKYNIEINLPIKVVNTTADEKVTPKKLFPSFNNIGQKRTIVYTTEPIIEGRVEDVDYAFINKNIIPNNIKFLTLDNSEPLNINSLNVQIRRAKTNELATELEDASIELLIKSE
jgi:hypothetical protein